MSFNSIISLTFFLLFHLSTHLQAYNPVDNFTISCGSTGKFSDGERTWTGDTDSMFLSGQDSTVSATATTQSPFTNQVPFITARLSRSQFNYSFPVSAGPKFLRLFFHPASYPSFPRTDASFTVQSNQFTLLNGFNTSLTADVENTETIFKEYMVNVDDGERLNLTFNPSQPNCYAFINGIEVFSMPSDLYYTTANDTGFIFVGNDTLYRVGTSALLETQYRIKVGGQGILPPNDTCLFRIWAGHDEDYLVTQNLRDNLMGDMDDKINITVYPEYVAPKELYRTARDMGLNGTLNKSLNLTWEFPVDSGFTYMLRLHFCELDPRINNISDRVFFIYIASYLAEEHADVLRWSKKQKGVAVQRDYAVLIPKNKTQKKVNLLLQLHPCRSGREMKYIDPVLNGLDIFKVSQGKSNNLVEPQIPVSKGKSNRGSGTRIIGVVAAVVSGVVLISILIVNSLVGFFVFLSVTSESDPLLFSRTNTQNSSLSSDHCRNFSLVEMKAATNNFDDVFIVGAGGFGHVYKGYIHGGSTPIAVKRLKPDSQQGAREFKNEIEMLSQLRHRHLVPLIGYCNDNNEMILVYDFMARGNLRDHLYDTDKPPFSWKQRLHISIGAARGLHYLHTGAMHVIIHRDVKTTNILLNDKWVAKVSDFSLSRIGPTDMPKDHVSSAVKGSFGYLDPEYYNWQRLTEKSDVYSFGVVLFQILCA